MYLVGSTSKCLMVGLMLKSYFRPYRLHCIYNLSWFVGIHRDHMRVLLMSCTQYSHLYTLVGCRNHGGNIIHFMIRLNYLKIYSIIWLLYFTPRFWELDWTWLGVCNVGFEALLIRSVVNYFLCCLFYLNCKSS